MGKSLRSRAKRNLSWALDRLEGRQRGAQSTFYLKKDSGRGKSERTKSPCGT
jgi:hypothetical protein